LPIPQFEETIAWLIKKINMLDQKCMIEKAKILTLNKQTTTASQKVILATHTVLKYLHITVKNKFNTTLFHIPLKYFDLSDLVKFEIRYSCE